MGDSNNDAQLHLEGVDESDSILGMMPLIVDTDVVMAVGFLLVLLSLQSVAGGLEGNWNSQEVIVDQSTEEAEKPHEYEHS